MADMPLKCALPLPAGGQPAISAAAWAALGALGAASWADLLPVADHMLEAAGHLVAGCSATHSTAGSSRQRGGPPKPPPPAAAAGAAAVKAVAQLLAAVAQSNAVSNGGAADVADSGAGPMLRASNLAGGGPRSPRACAATWQGTGAAAAALPAPDALLGPQAATLWLAAADRVLFAVCVPCCWTSGRSASQMVSPRASSCSKIHPRQHLSQRFDEHCSWTCLKPHSDADHRWHCCRLWALQAPPCSRRRSRVWRRCRMGRTPHCPPRGASSSGRPSPGRSLLMLGLKRSRRRCRRRLRGLLGRWRRCRRLCTRSWVRGCAICSVGADAPVSTGIMHSLANLPCHAELFVMDHAAGHYQTVICNLPGAEDGSAAAMLERAVRSGSLAVCTAAAASLATFCDTLGRLCSGRGTARGLGCKNAAGLQPTGDARAARSADALFVASVDSQLSWATWLRLLQGMGPLLQMLNCWHAACTPPMHGNQ